jgi:hypothetical protein
MDANVRTRRLNGARSPPCHYLGFTAGALAGYNLVPVDLTAWCQLP